MTKRLTAAAGALLILALVLAAASAAVAATPVNGKWRGVVTYQVRADGKWRPYTAASRRALSFFVDGGKNKRIVLFDSKTIAMGCNARQPLHGHSITVHPEILGLTSSDRVPVSRSGRFNRKVDDMFDVPSLPGVQVEILFWIKGQFTSARTVRAELWVDIGGCGYSQEGWSASMPAPKRKRTPHKTPTPGVDDGGAFYGCHLLWCGFELPPPFVPSLS